MSLDSFIYRLYDLLGIRCRPYTVHSSWINKPIESVANQIIDLFNNKIIHGLGSKKSDKVGTNKSKRENEIIVSLTTYPDRIDKVWMVIESMLVQTLKPDRVILWLAEDEFQGIDELPENLSQQMKRGLEIKFCKNIRSHKKYYYAIKEFDDSIIILIDDDFIYPRYLLNDLYREYINNPKCIITRTAAVVHDIESSLPSSWGRLGKRSDYVSESDLQAFTGSGTLLPPHALPEEALDLNNIEEICPYADDLWLFYFSRKNGFKTKPLLPPKPFPIPLFEKSRSSLWEINGPLGGQNDVQWKRIIQKFGLLSQER